MRPLTLRRLFLQCSLLAAILFVVVVVALKLGAVPVSLYGLGRDLISVLLHQTSALSSDYGMIVIDIRLPRILLAIFVGASLSVAGTSFQALLRNPLADPYILGVSSGAAVGAILAVVAQTHLALPVWLATLTTPLGAFLLAGVISASFLSAIIIFLMSTLSRDVRGMAFWLMGDLSNSLQPSLRWVLGAGFFVASVAIYTTAADLNLLLAGEKEAMHLGVDVHRVRLVVYIAASILTGLAVSVSGAIGYVGILVPHVMRLLFGSDHRILLPTAAFGGAIAVVAADTLARTVVAPSELPVGAIFAIVGAPLFIYLLRRGSI